MPAHLQSLVPLRHARHRTVLDAVWSTQLDIGPGPALVRALGYLSSRPPPRLAGVVLSHEALPCDVRAELVPLCERVCQAAQGWGLLAPADAPRVSERALLMTLRGAQPHTDIPSARWMDKLFWALSVRDTDTDVLFGNLEHRVELKAGTLLVFDPCQPHAVVAREHNEFRKSHFSKSRLQFLAGGDFPAQDWAALGVTHRLTSEDIARRRNVVNMLVHSQTCRVKRADALTRWQDSR